MNTPIEVRTKREPGNIFISFRKCFIVIYSHKYVNLLQILIKDIENEKVRCVFQKNWNDFVVSGFKVIAHGDGTFPRSIVKRLAFNYVIELKLTAVIYLRCCKITSLTILIYPYCLRPEPIKINAILYISSAREIVTSSHATRLSWGCKMTFSSTGGWCEIFFPYARNIIDLRPPSVILSLNFEASKYTYPGTKPYMLNCI